MAWKIEFTEAALRELEKLANPIGIRISKFLREQVAPFQNPRSIGQALKGERFGKLWKYRVGEHCLTANIIDDARMILILGIGHRREIHR